MRVWYQDRYYQKLGAVQLRGEWTEWVRFLATGVEVACRESMQIAKDLTAIVGRWKEALATLKLRADAAVNRLPVLVGTPVVTVNQVMKGLDIAFPAANKALTQLQGLGIVEPLKDQKRNRAFAAREVIELLNRPTQVDLY